MIDESLKKTIFFTLIATGIIFSLISCFNFSPDFPERAKIAIIWMSISMGLFWTIDRILHALADAAGETERDGIIWLVPIAFGWIPVSLGWIISFKYLFCSIFLYCFVSYIVVTICRPEIPQDRLPAIGQNGFSSWKNGFRLFQYKMKVDEPRNNNINVQNTQANKFRFFSISYLFYTACFGSAALITSVREVSDIKYMNEAITIIVGGTAVLIPIVFSTAFAPQTSKEEEIPWRIQKLEPFVLSCLYIITSVYIIAFLYWMKEIY
jgi:hypothetical protein